MIVPPAVAAEVQRFPLPHWVVVTPLPPRSSPNLRISGLGPGETEAIRLAIAINARRILVDDAAARTAARSAGLATLGVVGIVLAAKKLGLLRLLNRNWTNCLPERFTSPRLYRLARIQAGD